MRNTFDAFSKARSLARLKRTLFADPQHLCPTDHCKYTISPTQPHRHSPAALTALLPPGRRCTGSLSEHSTETSGLLDVRSPARLTLRQPQFTERPRHSRR